MNAQTLTSLVAVSIKLVEKGNSQKAFHPSTRFTLPVALTSYADAELTWTPANPLTLSYRWFDMRAKCTVSDGIRTSLPVPPLKPGVDLEIELVGRTPKDLGLYRLKMSLVLEGVHWACDVGSGAWCDVDVELTPTLPWPASLTRSRGGKAIRGAIAAAEMGRRLKGRTFAVDQTQTGLVPATNQAASDCWEPELAISDSGSCGIIHSAHRPVDRQPHENGAEPEAIDALLDFASQQERRIGELLTIIGEKDRGLRDMNERFFAVQEATEKAAPLRKRGRNKQSGNIR